MYSVALWVFPKSTIAMAYIIYSNLASYRYAMGYLLNFLHTSVDMCDRSVTFCATIVPAFFFQDYDPPSEGQVVLRPLPRSQHDPVLALLARMDQGSVTRVPAEVTTHTHTHTDVKTSPCHDLCA